MMIPLRRPIFEPGPNSELLKLFLFFEMIEQDQNLPFFFTEREHGVDSIKR